MAQTKEAVENRGGMQDKWRISMQNRKVKSDLSNLPPIGSGGAHAYQNNVTPSTGLSTKSTYFSECIGAIANLRRQRKSYPKRDSKYLNIGSKTNLLVGKCIKSRINGWIDVPRRERWSSFRPNVVCRWYIFPVICTLVLIMSPMTNARTNQSTRDIARGRTSITNSSPGLSIFMGSQHEDTNSQSGAYSWGPWGRVTSCTRTCGLGVRYRRRVCYKVRAGKMELAESTDLCSGPERRYETCPGQPECTSDPGLRLQQCAAHNSQPYKGRLYRWKPYKRKPGHTHSVQINSCALVCCAEGFSARHFAVRFSSKVRDGTPCDLGFNDLDLGIRGVCINGSCVRVGCDGTLYSNRVLDQCNVCGGDNSTCRTIRGRVIKQVSMGYTNIVTIPRLASHIRIIEQVDTGAVFAVRDDAGILFVNGRSSENYPTIYRHIPGLVFRYYHSLYSHDGLERLEGDGRSNETLYIMILQPGKRGEVRVSYQYSLPYEDKNEAEDIRTEEEDPTSLENFVSYEGPPITTSEPYFIPEHGQSARWEAMRMHHGHDDQTVGDPSRLASYSSSEISFTTTSGSYTTANVNSTEDSFPSPEVGMPGESVPANVGGKYRNPQTNSGSFSYFWKIDTNAPCSATCTSGVQSRYARCFRSDNVVVEISYCEEGQRPKPVNVRCQGRPCSPRWVASLWSSCSVSCGTGQQFRTVHCWRMMAPGFDSTVHDYLCSTQEKPFLARPCKELDCGPLWETSQWGECSRKCGRGIQTRNVRCSSENQPCETSEKPRTSRRCVLGPCVHDWIVSDWGECSGNCGTGTRKRSVTCRENDGEFLHDKYCNEQTRPLSVQACTIDGGSCPPKWVPQDWGVCSVDCDWGDTTRDVACGSVINGSFLQLPDRSCRGQPLPRKIAKCREPPCKARWHFTNWSQCSKSCGEGGVRVRKVACYRDNKHSRHCDANTKPASTDVCLNRPCQQDVEPDRGP